MSPDFICSASLRGSDDIGSGLFDHAESVEFQPTDDRRLSRTWRTRDNKPFHVLFFLSELEERLKIASSLIDNKNSGIKPQPPALALGRNLSGRR